MERIEYILDFCKELGKQMIASGANIERVNLSIERICHAYGLHDVTCANLSSRISISAKDENKRYAHRQTNVPPQNINLERLKKLNNLAFDICKDKPQEETLSDLLQGVKSNDFPWWVMMIGFLVAMMGLARIFCAGWSEILVVELNTLLLFGLSRALTKVHINKIITNFFSMFLCSLIAMGFYAAHFINSFYIVVITNAFFLIPGIPMINCARNILCGNEMNGAIDLLKVLLEVCSIVAGVAAAYAILGGAIDYPLIEDSFNLRNNLDPWLSSFELIVLTLMASAGFSVVFNIQLKDLPFAALGGVIVRVVHILFKLAFPAFAFAYTIFAAFFAALYSEILAIIKKEPSTLYLYPSIVPLIPGDLFYYTALGIIWGNVEILKGFGPDLVLSLIGISVGFVLCSTIVHYIRKFKFLKLNNSK
ncbi:MAG: threonine/serine exporter family protein [Bacilli bacterium]|nr:threonine/serine exporter family protein [Bacilli bacterium]